MEVEEKRIYVVLPAKVRHFNGLVTVVQPAGRQIAQACHAVSKLRKEYGSLFPDKLSHFFSPVTTIILHARDDREMFHVSRLLTSDKIPQVFFRDTNEDYGGSTWTALATYGAPEEMENILDYLPLWRP